MIIIMNSVLHTDCSPAPAYIAQTQMVVRPDTDVTNETAVSLLAVLEQYRQEDFQYPSNVSH